MKIKVTLETGYVGGTQTDILEIPDKWLEDKTEEEKEKIIQDEADIWMWERIGFYWSVVEEGEG